MALLFLGGAYIAYLLFGHVQARVDDWLDPFAPATSDSYQIVHGLFGLACGGLLGRGLGQGGPSSIAVRRSPTSSSPRSARSSA